MRNQRRRNGRKQPRSRRESLDSRQGLLKLRRSISRGLQNRAKDPLSNEDPLNKALASLGPHNNQGLKDHNSRQLRKLAHNRKGPPNRDLNSSKDQPNQDPNNKGQPNQDPNSKGQPNQEPNNKGQPNQDPNSNKGPVGLDLNSNRDLVSRGFANKAPQVLELNRQDLPKLEHPPQGLVLQGLSSHKEQGAMGLLDRNQPAHCVRPLNSLCTPRNSQTTTPAHNVKLWCAAYVDSALRILR